MKDYDGPSTRNEKLVFMTEKIAMIRQYSGSISHLEARLKSIATKSRHAGDAFDMTFQEIYYFLKEGMCESTVGAIISSLEKSCLSVPYYESLQQQADPQPQPEQQPEQQQGGVWGGTEQQPGQQQGKHQHLVNMEEHAYQSELDNLPDRLAGLEAIVAAQVVGDIPGKKKRRAFLASAKRSVTKMKTANTSRGGGSSSGSKSSDSSGSKSSNNNSGSGSGSRSSKSGSDGCDLDDAKMLEIFALFPWLCDLERGHYAFFPVKLADSDQMVIVVSLSVTRTWLTQGYARKDKYLIGQFARSKIEEFANRFPCDVKVDKDDPLLTETAFIPVKGCDSSFIALSTQAFHALSKDCSRIAGGQEAQVPVLQSKSTSKMRVRSGVFGTAASPQTSALFEELFGDDNADKPSEEKKGKRQAGARVRAGKRKRVKRTVEPGSEEDTDADYSVTCPLKVCEE